MAKRVLAVGTDLPIDDIDEVAFLSDRSLLDADIILFQPGIPYTYGSDTYKGKTCLSDDGSFQVKEAMAHWQRELAAAYDAGKFVIVFLDTPEVVYAATGQKTWSGTGRNARATRIVDELHAYSAIPVEWDFNAATGSEMVADTTARFFAPYWAEFSRYSQYRLYIEAGDALPLVRTKSGGRLVGAYVRKGRGGFLAVPVLDLQNEDFIEVRKVDGKDQTFWTESAVALGKRFIASVVAMADAFVAENASSPPPDWVADDSYSLAAERKLQSEISVITTKLISLEERRRGLEDELGRVGSIRGLLYEQGKPLEEVVRSALQTMGFAATNLKEADSEFDVVFQSPEGRFIGEVEGKDNKAVNIDKFSQLERNLNEDFAREEVVDFAKGVLFGNAYRLKAPLERKDPFTEKCITAAKRLGAALVCTKDLFEPCRYLSEVDDPDYAAACRQAILTTTGAVVAFPSPPNSLDGHAYEVDVTDTVSTNQTQ